MHPQHYAPEDTWSPIQFGTVEDTNPVEFDPERGPVVNVALQPSRVPVRCRVAMPIAGRGEASFFPFSPGDEVVVAAPHGPRGECVIVGRLSNAVDTFPTSVAGQDATKNALSFVRGLSAHVEEYKGLWSVFSQPSGAFVSVSAAGTVTLRDGSKGALQLSPDLFGYQSGDAAHLIQLDLGGDRLTIRVGSSMLVLAGADSTPTASALLAVGPFSLSAAGQPAGEHVATVEGTVNLLAQLFLSIASASPGPLTGATLLAAFTTALPAAITLAAVTPITPIVGTTITGAFAAALAKPPPLPGFGQLSPGLGCSGFLSG